MNAALAVDGHICLVVDDGETYGDLATDFLLAGSVKGEKPIAFAPAGSAIQEQLRRYAAVIADPYVDFLGLRPLDPVAMSVMFREQAALAVSEGYTSLRVAADMDWLLPTDPSPDDALGFEVMLGQVVSEVGATVLCAYRRSSFRQDLVLRVACTHSVVQGHDAPPFKLVPGKQHGWVLSGEVDFQSAPVLASALRATIAEPWVVDASGLEFVDVAGMRAIAGCASTAAAELELRHVTPRIRRLWQLAGFDEAAPCVRFAD